MFWFVLNVADLTVTFRYFESFTQCLIDCIN